MILSADILREVLCCPETGQPMVFQGNAFVSPVRPEIRFPIEEGLLKAFLPNEGWTGKDVSQTMQAFYEKTPFPHYDEMETVGSLIEKSLDRIFPEMLNRSIPPGSSVLEVGCGTGQLGNFLSIADRKVISVDMCLNSLRLAQNFKERNHLKKVAFGQMNLFRLPLKAGYFQTVICTGVLHHTSNPFLGFQQLVPLVKPGGHIIIGLYNRYGRLKTCTKQILTRFLGRRIVQLDPYLKNYRMSQEKIEAWYMDQYRNPHESLHTIDEVMGWFRKTGIKFVRSIPDTVVGSNFELEYHNSLFNPSPAGTRTDRMANQLHQMVTNTEGGLFIMIGKKS